MIDLDPEICIKINPYIESKIPELNEKLKEHSHFVDGMEFTVSEIFPDRKTRIHVKYPEGTDEVQQKSMDAVFTSIIRNFNFN